MPASAAIMKLPVCIMTSLLWVLGQCRTADPGIQLNCIADWNILKVSCTVGFPRTASNCMVEDAFLNNTAAIVSGNDTFTVDVMVEEGWQYFTVRTNCGVENGYFEVTHVAALSGEHDENIDGKSLTPTDDPPVQAGAMWAIGILTVALIVGIVLMFSMGLRRHSSLWRSRMWTQSADTDVERNDSSEPLSVGQEPRDTHTPVVASDTDEASS
ncbi:uncharacterized protein LOC121705681 [Alosa sapidissima]|uniref:uncharacterized protein LOC121705681 n=1 Tax=Alosa sapidissima TaxID=34773 RepID=UPI001C0848A3|nr:uncharacterized protein LOC121705681 [Alosa sapidissima]